MFDFKRTHDCGTLNSTFIGEKITLSGWVHRRRDHGGLIFIDLRDRYGLTQLVFDPKISKECHELSNKLRSEWVITIKGEVIPRREGMTNPKMATGEIEVQIQNLEILSQSLTPPFSVCDEIDVNEELRLQYRFLDIRRGDIIEKLAVRHKVMQQVRGFLDNQGFLEITTPILAKSTPEGARDYLVPSRIYPGNFFALPQSPQIFKQLLMISGLDKYFQIATCFRDEDLRADRQPEFTQIDIEMSFLTPEDLFPLIEDLQKSIFKKCLGFDLPTPFQRMSYKDCIEYYGTDKPDLRFDMKLVRLDDIIARSDFSLLKKQLDENGCVKALCVKGGAEFSRRQIDELTAFIGKFGVNGLAWMKRTEGKFASSVVKFFNEELLGELQERMNAEDGDLILIAAEQQGRVNQGLDHLRRHIAKVRGLVSENDFSFLWVTDFPLFTRDEATGAIKTEHHPFTHPHPDDMEYLETDPLKVRALAYDLVLNGYEIASGSQRIHNGDLQKSIFESLNLSPEEIENKFGFFVQALKYGTPPHLGIALGLDRMIMILTNTDNIRDVIAFPKTQKASDLMMQAPSPIDREHLDLLELQTEDINTIAWP